MSACSLILNVCVFVLTGAKHRPSQRRTCEVRVFPYEYLVPVCSIQWIRGGYCVSELNVFDMLTCISRKSVTRMIMWVGYLDQRFCVFVQLRESCETGFVQLRKSRSPVYNQSTVPMDSVIRTKTSICDGMNEMFCL